MSDPVNGEYVPGIDLGTNSGGWAIIALVDGEPASLVRAGVRVFEAGMEGDIESGQEQSKNLKRREARLHRRQLWRRARRLTKTFNLLREFGLLPNGDASTPEKRQDLINALDKAIRASDWFKAKAGSGAHPEPNQTLPYILRAAALAEPLEPHLLGRALYHLAERRGFLSGRLKPAKADEEDGKVKGAIKNLREQMKQQGSRTLGDFLSRLSPTERRIRGPEAWTARDMHEKEFEAIWDAQAQHRPDVLSADRKEKLREAIFHQRPLKFDPDVIGRCELEPEERRAPAYLLIAQRFRVLQTVNNLRLLPPGETEKPLTPGDRRKLVDALELKSDLKFKQVRKLLGLTEEYIFKGEPEGEKRVIGNRTSASLYEVFRDRWLAMSAGERDRAVESVQAFPRAEQLLPIAKRDWSLDDEAAEEFSQIRLEPGYMNLSRKAMERLVPRLEQAESFTEARKAEYPESFKSFEPLPLLPPLQMEDVQRRVGVIRNPAVTRSLSELRRVVNAVVRSYGKPTQIRIELARQIKKSKKQRQAISRRNRENEALRKQAAERIREMTGDQFPSRDDIRRVQLFDDCHGQCLYCGENIPGRGFLGKESQVDIDHMIPFSRSLDDSYLNLVICHSHCNRAKGDLTPYEAFSGDAERYAAILDRVKRLAGDRRTAAEKLRRFTMNEEQLSPFLDDFRNRQLNDTAYAARLATRYLGLLYGGLADAQHEQRVFAPSGQTTAYFRNLWNLNSILNDGPSTGGGRVAKSRADHRHHAVDAVVIALTDARMVKRLSDAAQRAPLVGRRRFAALEGPWPNFVDTVRTEIAHVVASHRVSKKASGPLHEDTFYSLKGGFEGERRVRKPLSHLTKAELSEIADEAVKKLVIEKLGDGDPKKVFSSSEKVPCFTTKDGRRIPIKRVRIKKALPTFTLGEGRAARHVTSESNHHVEVFAESDKDAKEGKWVGEVVTMFEAYQRLKAHQPVVKRDHGPSAKFKFSLAPGEVIECDDGHGGRKLWVVRGTTSQDGCPRLFLVPINDAREKSDIVKSGLYWRPFLNPLRKLSSRKVVVSPLGELSEVHD